MQITPAESQIMEALWRDGPMSFDEVMDRVATDQGWARSTVKTLVNRLLHKKAIASERSGGKHGYRAIVSREDYVEAESQNLLDRLFDGRIEPLISHFAKYRDLKPAELERLKQHIEALEKGEQTGADDDE